MTQTTSSAQQPSFRSIRPDDVGEVSELIQAAFGERWPGFPIRVTPLEHLEWKLNSPQAIPGGTTVLELDGRIVAYDGSVGRDVWLHGQRVPGWVSVDSAVHPSFQGRGLSKTHLKWFLARWARAQQPVALDEGSTHPRFFRSSGPGSERVRVANTVDVLVLPLDVAAIAKRALTRRSLRSVLGVSRLCAKMLAARIRWRPFSTPAPSVAIRTVDSFDDRADALWERCRDAFEYAVVRDCGYLNWRYCDPRAGIYRVRIAECDGELVGFVITTVRGREVQLVDLLAIHDDRGVLRALIEDAVGSARDEGKISLSLLMPRIHVYQETLRRHRFLRSKSETNMGYRPRNDSALDFLERDRGARLHVSYGDTDHI